MKEVKNIDDMGAEPTTLIEQKSPRFQMYLKHREGPVEIGDAFDTMKECEILAPKILSVEKSVISIDVVQILATFEKEFRVVRTR